MRRPSLGALVVVLLSAVLAATSCSGGSQQEVPPRTDLDACALYNNFQMFSFSARSGRPVPPPQFESFFRGLVDGASRLSRARPELKGTLDIVVNGDLALASGKPVPPPDPGQPTFEAADATMAGYQGQLCR